MLVRRSRLLVWKRPRNELWNNTCVYVLRKCGSVLANDGGLGQSAHANGNWCRDVNVCCGQAGHEKVRCRFRNAKCSNCGKTGHLRAMCRQREKVCWKVKSLEQQWQEFWQRQCEPWKHSSAVVVDRSVIDDLIALVETRVASSLCGKRGHLSQVCRSSSGNANARAVEVEPVEPEEERNSTRVGTVSL